MHRPILSLLLLHLFLCQTTAESAFTPCKTSNDCPEHYSCFSTPDFTSLVCISVSEAPTNGVEVGVGYGVGVTFDICAQDDDCRGDRTCRLITDSQVTDCDSRPSCICLTPEPIRCDSDDQCDTGEICADTVMLGPICVSKIAVDSEAIPVVDDEQHDDQPISDDESVSNDGTGLVLEPCNTFADCLPPRQCLDIVGAPDIICPENSDNQCVCSYLTIPPCVHDADCADGEACTPRSNGDHDICVSKSVLAAGGDTSSVNGMAVPSPGVEAPPTKPSSDTDDFSTTAEPSTTDEGNTQVDPDTTTENEALPSEEAIEEAVCVDAELLQHLHAEELVFSEHRFARVLCDGFGSCGTAGHMVRWMGRVMMMKSYCAEVGCVKRLKKVNSPRYKRGRIVVSRSDGLVFMALAARFETRVEEQLLRGIIRIGL